MEYDIYRQGLAHGDTQVKLLSGQHCVKYWYRCEGATASPLVAAPIIITPLAACLERRNKTSNHCYHTSCRLPGVWQQHPNRSITPLLYLPRLLVVWYFIKSKTTIVLSPGV